MTENSANSDRSLLASKDIGNAASQGILAALLARPVTVSMITLAAVVFGVVSFAKLPLELLPDISYPTLTVQTELPDAAPQEVELLVTQPVEQVVGVVQGLRRYHSTSRAGVSEVTLEFGWETDMSRASLDVREKLDLVELPDDARSPVVYRFDPSLDPMLRIALEGEFETNELRRIAETIVSQRLVTIEGVAAARVVGGAEEEVRVSVEDERLNALNLPFEEIARRIGEENVNRSGGELRDRDTAYRLRTVSEFETLEEIGDTIVRRSNEGVIRVRDLGTVSAASDDREVRVRVNGTPAVQLHLYKEGDANTVQVARAVRRRLDSLADEKALAGCQLEILFDQARYIEEAVENVQSSALVGAALAALMLYFFLGDLLSTTIIALSIPISVAVTFLLMRIFGISLNVMSLGGLALGVGMLVDNSVVVLEAVSRLRERGVDAWSAAVRGTRQVIGGVIASTLTTISVFLPLVFVEGIAGQVFRDQALTVTFSLLASLFVSITLIPVVLAHRKEAPRVLRWIAQAIGLVLSPFRKIFVRGLDVSSSVYSRVLDSALPTPWATPVIALVLFLAVVPRAADLGTELVPDLFQGEFHYDLELSEGTSLETTDAKVQELEAAVERVRRDPSIPIKTSYATIGSAPVLGEVRSSERRDHVARLSIQMESTASLDDEARAVEAIDAEIAKIPDCPVRLGRPTLFTFRAPIEVDVYDENLDRLRESALEVASRLRFLPGLVDVEDGVPDRSPEVHVVLDPVKLAAYGLSQGQVAQVLAAKGLGEVPTQFRHAARPIDIRVQADSARVGTLDDTARLTITPGTEDVPALRLASLGTLRPGLGPVEIQHIGGERSISVTARTSGVDLGSASKIVDDVLRSTPLAPTSSASLSGQNEEMRSSLRSLSMALALAIFLVTMVLASTFESLTLPFVVILTVPLGLIGAIGALWVLGWPVGVLALIGVILLSGIVVNNGIIFVVRILQLRDRGLGSETAARAAGLERLRPILITSSTTILGLLPLALGVGAGAELRRPLAVTVIGGMAVATILTLTVIPCGYRLLAREKPLEGAGGS